MTPKMGKKTTEFAGLSPRPATRGLDNELFTVSLYIRVSTDRQAKEGDSLEEQESELKKYCDYRGFRIHNILIEKGKSGGNTNRPEYQKLIKDIEAKKIDAVVVKKLDRLSRSLLDFEQLMTTMQEHDVEFVSLKENFDTTTAMGKAMLRVALVFAQLEREQTSERITDVMGYRASIGLHNGGRTPFGYLCLNKELVPFKKEQQIVEIIFQKFLETKSVASVAEALQATHSATRKGALWTDSQLRRILQNPIYKGSLRWHDKTYPGLHQPLVAESLWEKVQTIFSQRGHLGNADSKSEIQKLLRCGYCSSPMTPSYAIKQKTKKYYYYRCTSGTHGKKSTCLFKHVAYPRIHSAVKICLILLTQDRYFRPLETRITAHNTHIEATEQSIHEQITQLETELTDLKNKHDQYLDALITQTLSSPEKQRLNDRIEELLRDSKQTKSKITTLHLELTAHAEAKISLIALKTQLLHFRDKADTWDIATYRAYLLKILTDITYFPEKLSFHFSGLPWPIEMVMPPP